MGAHTTKPERKGTSRHPWHARPCCPSFGLLRRVDRRSVALRPFNCPTRPRGRLQDMPARSPRLRAASCCRVGLRSPATPSCGVGPPALQPPQARTSGACSLYGIGSTLLGGGVTAASTLAFLGDFLNSFMAWAPEEGHG